ncbi:hypothetical protein BJY04DRAFT_103791 [Aspergillus karnatakaensis]|uniref:Lectin C-type domain protein n=1 Tax=Aspergillus karnatakaensis TaxID=1810916 RepID=UPI003CCD08D1
MSLKFDPDESLLNSSWATVLLSERDVAGQIPINFVTTSAISLQAACFGDNSYDRTEAENCLSNLIAVGYRRFNIDVYWSPGLRRWLLCPVSIPQPTPNVEGAVATELDESSDTLYDLGPYRCSDGLALPDLLNVIRDYLRDTDSDLLMNTRFLSLNLHIAADPASIDEPASTVSREQLPTESERISHIVKDKLGSYIYGPSNLLEDRRDLNASWYAVDDGYKPIVQYYTIERDAEGVQSTPDGWPSAKYVQLATERRLLVEYGTVDSQLEAYGLSVDNDVIFSPGYMTSTVPVSAADEGSLDSLCLYDPDNTDISNVNASWAITNHIPLPQNLSNDQSLRYISDLVVNLTACGITSTLNSTLFGNNTADNNPDPYRNLTLSSSWAWALGQPEAQSDGTDSSSEEDKRCAIMDVSLNGHWRTANCSQERLAACRVENHHFRWSISSSLKSYEDAYNDACPQDTTFAVPRTGLENTYLYRHLLAQSSDIIDPDSSDPLKHEIWIDFNSQDIATCWVTGGPGASCPYTSDPDQLERRTVLVAAIAGIVICIIAALTLFVKCNANRRNSRRNKRVIQGWEYEGVPS